MVAQRHGEEGEEQGERGTRRPLHGKQVRDRVPQRLRTEEVVPQRDPRPCLPGALAEGLKVESRSSQVRNISQC